ncbi:MAG: IS110 family transposase [Arenicellales bacterium]
MKIKRIGVDLAKNVYQLHGVDRGDKCLWKRRLKRGNWLKVLFEKAEPGCEIGMEACTGFHHWARLLREKGYVVKLIAPQDIQAMHRVRSELICHRTAKANQIRGLVSEYGLVAPQQMASLRRAIPEWLEEGKNGLTDRFRELLNGLWGDLSGLDQRVSELDQDIQVVAESHAGAKRLQQLRGVGPMIATALVAAVGNGEHFTKGRQMSASLGLTPRQHSSGNKDRLLGISKRGDPYLRSLLVHGARAAIWASRNKDDRLSRWAKDLAAPRHPNIAAVALASKTVRMAWAILKNQEDYQPDKIMVS